MNVTGKIESGDTWLTFVISDYDSNFMLNKEPGEGETDRLCEAFYALRAHVWDS